MKHRNESVFNPWLLWLPAFGVTRPPYGCLNATFCYTSLHFFHFFAMLSTPRGNSPALPLLIYHRSSRPSSPGGRELFCRHYTLLLPVVNIYHYFCATGRLTSLPCKGLGVAKLFAPVDSRSGARRRLVAVNPYAAMVCEFRPAAAPRSKKTARGKTFFADFSPPAIAASKRGAAASVRAHRHRARTCDSESGRSW